MYDANGDGFLDHLNLTHALSVLGASKFSVRDFHRARLSTGEHLTAAIASFDEIGHLLADLYVGPSDRLPALGELLASLARPPGHDGSDASPDPHSQEEDTGNARVHLRRRIDSNKDGRISEREFASAWKKRKALRIVEDAEEHYGRPGASLSRWEALHDASVSGSVVHSGMNSRNTTHACRDMCRYTHTVDNTSTPTPTCMHSHTCTHTLAHMRTQSHITRLGFVLPVILLVTLTHSLGPIVVHTMNSTVQCQQPQLRQKGVSACLLLVCTKSTCSNDVFFGNRLV